MVTRIVSVALVIVAITGAVLYHGARKETEQYKALSENLQEKLDEAWYKALGEATRAVLESVAIGAVATASKDERYASVQEEHLTTIEAISSAQNAPGDLDINGSLPLALTDPLVRLREIVCAVSGSLAPTRESLQ